MFNFCTAIGVRKMFNIEKCSILNNFRSMVYSVDHVIQIVASKEIFRIKGKFDLSVTLHDSNLLIYNQKFKLRDVILNLCLWKAFLRTYLS